MQKHPGGFAMNFKEDSLFQAKQLWPLRITASPLWGHHWASTTTALRLLPVGNKQKNRTAGSNGMLATV